MKNGSNELETPGSNTESGLPANLYSMSNKELIKFAREHRGLGMADSVRISLALAYRLEIFVEGLDLINAGLLAFRSQTEKPAEEAIQ
jgi:hypothetical protein